MGRHMRYSIVAGLALWAATALAAYAHDPSASKKPTKMHIHVKGKITTPDGKPLPGTAPLIVIKSGEGILGIPAGCLDTYDTTTWANGYDVVVYLETEAKCREAFDKITVDKAKIIIKKEGYDFKPK